MRAPTSVFGHGPHQERGIEIYHGKPILYALGNFVLHNDLIKWEPWDLYNRYGLGPEATRADVYDFRSGNGTRGMAVEPIRWQTVIAEVAIAEEILCRVQRLSSAFDTQVDVEDGRGVIHVS